MFEHNVILFMCNFICRKNSPNDVSGSFTGYVRIGDFFFFINNFFIFPLYSKGVRLSLYVYITIIFFPPPFLLLGLVILINIAELLSLEVVPSSAMLERLPSKQLC